MLHKGGPLRATGSDPHWTRHPGALGATCRPGPNGRCRHRCMHVTLSRWPPYESVTVQYRRNEGMKCHSYRGWSFIVNVPLPMFSLPLLQRMVFRTHHAGYARKTALILPIPSSAFLRCPPPLPIGTGSALNAGHFAPSWVHQRGYLGQGKKL